MIECPAIAEFWKTIEREFPNIFDTAITDLDKELGNTRDEEEDTFIDKHLLMMIARKYIYQCNIDETEPTFTGLACQLRYYERVEYEIAVKHDGVDNHFAKWEEIRSSLSLGIPL